MVLPVDVPQLPAELLCRLLDAHEGLPQEERRKPFLVKHKERTEPLIGVYPKEMADFIEKQIKEQGAPVFVCWSNGDMAALRQRFLPGSWRTSTHRRLMKNFCDIRKGDETNERGIFWKKP